ncbi:MAG: hypothetical protein QM723_13130 [Myxococcaceae bacterium]
MLVSRRIRLIALVSLTLVTQLAGLAHEALASHAVCAEHGEWIESDASAAPGHIDGVDALTDGADLSLEAPGHEHCAVIAHRRTPARAIGGTVVSTAVEVPRPPVAAPRLATLGGLAPLDVAPKASPPAQG